RQRSSTASIRGRYEMSSLRDDAPDDVDLSRVWISVAAQVWRRQPGWLERTAGRLLRSPGLARALLTTPSLLLPWLLTSIVVLAAGVAATTGSGQPVGALLAPAMALAGATGARPVSAGAAAGVGAWLITVLCGQAVSGHFAAAVSDTVLFLPYLAIGAGCAAVAVYATRIPRGTL